MIKRRFYRHEHADGDDASNSSSSSSDSEVEAESAEETEAEDDDVAEAREYREAPSSSSGYESEDSSENEVDDDSSGLLTIDDGTGNDGKFDLKSHSSNKSDAVIWDMLSNTVAKKDSAPSDVACILKCKSVFRCRFCPRIVCLTEETLKAHLKSKRHARSERLLSEGRLKLMLNSDGEIEGEGETHAERHARFIAAAQNSANTGKKNKGRQRQRQRKRLKKKPGKESNLDKARQSTKGPAKKRHKSEP